MWDEVRGLRVTTVREQGPILEEAERGNGPAFGDQPFGEHPEVARRKEEPSLMGSRRDPPRLRQRQMLYRLPGTLFSPTVANRAGRVAR